MYEFTVAPALMDYRHRTNQIVVVRLSRDECSGMCHTRFLARFTDVYMKLVI